MSEMVQIRSVKQYFRDYIAKGLEGRTKVQEIDLIPIKNAMLDAFRKEIFGQIAFKVGPEAANMTPDELAGIEIVNNILVQSFRKWKRICILCSEAGLGNFFQLQDLKRVLEDVDKIEPDPQETVYIDEKMKQTIGEGLDVTDEIKGSPACINVLKEDP